MASKTTPKNDHLTAATRRWVEQICADYDLESHHLRILLTAAESWDRAATARQAIEKHGLMVKDRYGQLKTNPAAETERSSKILFLRAIRELGLDVEGPEESPRPPVAPANAARGR